MENKRKLLEEKLGHLEGQAFYIDGKLYIIKILNIYIIKNGDTALIAAIPSNDTHCISLLLSHPNIDVNLCNKVMLALYIFKIINLYNYVHIIYHIHIRMVVLHYFYQ